MRRTAVSAVAVSFFAVQGASIPPVFEPDAGGVFVARGARYRFVVERGAFQADGVRAVFAGARADARAAGRDPLASRSNYIAGSDRAAWRTNVPHYARVAVHGVYEGISIEYYFTDEGVEFDVVVAAGADPSLVRLRFEGGTPGLTAAGDLDFDGLRIRRPSVYQLAGGKRHAIDSRYVFENGEVRFAVADYDRAATLVIDPVIEWASFFGGAANEQADAVAVDSTQSVIIVGSTPSTNLNTANGRQPRPGGGATDAFIAKFAPDGKSLLWATYLGGVGREQARGVAVDAAGNIYVSGATDSPEFPTTPGVFKSDAPVATRPQIFVVKLDPAGANLLYSTVIGGPGVDESYRMAVDREGNAVVTGTAQAGFPTTAGAYKRDFAGNVDVFALKLNRSAEQLVFSTLLGSNGSIVPHDMELAPTGETIVTGFTSSTLATFVGTTGAYQPQRRGATDGFVAMFSADGSALRYLTFLGGTATEVARGVSLDSNGNVWVTGVTLSQDFPVTPNAPTRTAPGGGSDGFLARLPLPLPRGSDPADPPLVTYIGDARQNAGLDVLVVKTPNGRPAATAAINAAAEPGEAILNSALEFVRYSLSNLQISSSPTGGTTATSSNTIHDIDVKTGQSMSNRETTGSEVYNQAQARPDGTTAAAGSATPSVPTTPGAAQSTHAGGTGPDALDAQLALIAVFGGAEAMRVSKEVDLVLTRRRAFGAQAEGDFAIGDLVYFEIRVENNGPDTLKNVIVADIGEGLDQTLEFDVFLAGRRPCRPIALTLVSVCRLGDIAPGETGIALAVARVRDVRQVRNIAIAVADNHPPVRSEFTRDVVRDTSLRVVKERIVPPASQALGVSGSVEYRITVTNVGRETAVEVLLSDELGIGMQATSMTSPDPTVNCLRRSPDPQSLAPTEDYLCRKAELGVGQSFIVIAKVDFSGSPGLFITNAAEAFARNSDRTPLSRVTDMTGRPPTPEEVGCKVFSTITFDEVILGAPPSKARMASRQAEASRSAVDAGLDDQKAGIGPFDFYCVVLKPGVSPSTVIPDASFTFNTPLTNQFVDASRRTLGEVKLVVDRGAGQDTFQTPVLSADNKTIRFPGVRFPLGQRGDFSLRLEGTRFGTDTIPNCLTDDPNCPTGSGFLDIGADFSGDILLGGNTDAQDRVLVNKLQDILTAFNAERNSAGGVDLTASVLEGKVGGIVNAATFMVRVEGLVQGAFVDPSPACVPSLTDPLVHACKIDGADSQGRGGTVRPIGSLFTPQPIGGVLELVYRVVGTVRSSGIGGFRFPFRVRAGTTFSAPLRLGVRLLRTLLSGEDPRTLAAPLFRAPATQSFDINALLRGVLTIGPNGLLSAASGGAAGLGSVAALYGAFTGVPLTLAPAGPLTKALAGVEVIINGTIAFTGLESTGSPPNPAPTAAAPLYFVSDRQINFQIPWEVDVSSGFVDVTVTRDGVAGATARLPVARFAPGIFSFDFGPGRAVAINADGSVAHPADSFAGAIASRPVRIGEGLVILATGLGPTNPPAVTGANSFDASGRFVRRDTIEKPKVTLGGVEQRVLFSGMSPEFPGVHQLNIEVVTRTPAGNAVSLIVEIGGARSRADVTVAVAAP